MHRCHTTRTVAPRRLAPAPLPRRSHSKPQRGASVTAQAALKALIFSCDGAVVESDAFHRLAYNAAFESLDVRCGGEVVEWEEDVYEAALQMRDRLPDSRQRLRWLFDTVLRRWPSAAQAGGSKADPASGDEGVGGAVGAAAGGGSGESALAAQEQLLDALQAEEGQQYQQMLESGEVEARPGVLRLMDEAREAGLKLAVCSAAGKEETGSTLRALLGKERFSGLDVVVSGDDMQGEQQPQQQHAGTAVATAPVATITTDMLKLAAQRLGVQPSECLVVEENGTGLRAANGAGMRCIVTYTPSTKDQVFPGAERIISGLGWPANVTAAELVRGRVVQDDRIEMTITDSGVFFHHPGPQQGGRQQPRW